MHCVQTDIHLMLFTIIKILNSLVGGKALLINMHAEPNFTRSVFNIRI
jgi:pentose-5-phosphate-3-epimerase